MKKKRSSTTIVNIADFALKRDKEIASLELRDYFVSRNRQEKTWNLINAVKSGLRQNIFSTAEAKKITEFLARKFEIRLPAIEFAQAVHSPAIHSQSYRSTTQADALNRSNGGHTLFHQLFFRLQAGVQENLLDYNGARSLVGEIVSRYPKARGSLQR